MKKDAIFPIRQKLMMDMMNPTIAQLRGLLNIPKKESNAPTANKTKFTIGTQKRQMPKTAIINPAVPIPLDLCSIWFIVTCG